MNIAIINIATNERVQSGSLPHRITLPDGGVAQFDQVGDTRPAHAPIYRCVESRVEYGAVETEQRVVEGNIETITRPLAEWRALLRERAAAARYGKEVGGVEVGGASIKTDRESQAMIAGAFALVQDDPQKVIKFKTSAGFVDLDAAAVTAIARAVGGHVQACFALEADVIAQIEAQEIETFEAVDQAFA